MITKAGVIGAGVMGKGIARHLFTSGCQVTLIETNPEQAASAKAELSDTSIEVTGELSACEQADYVIEAIVEDLGLKHQLLTSLSELSETTVIASNTSSLLISDLAVAVSGIHRFLGVHYNNPADMNPIVEIIPTDETDSDIADGIQSWYSSSGKKTIRCKDTSGFVLNRQSLPYMNEAVRCLDSASPGQIDALAVNTLGVGLGPFAVMNLVGLKVMAAASRNLEVLGPGYQAASALQIQSTQDQATWQIDSDVDLSQLDADRLRDRLLGAMMFPGKDILHQALCSRDDLHLICIEALGYARSSPELLEQLTAEEVSRCLSSYQSGETD